MNRRQLPLLALIILFAGLIGCSGTTIKPEQPARAGWATLSAQQSLGQTITSNFEGLQGGIFYFRPIQRGEGEILLHLRSSPDALTDLRTARTNLAQLTEPHNFIFEFPPLLNSAHSDYFLMLELQGSGLLEASTGSRGSYSNGALYQGGAPQDSQITFKLLYDSHRLYSGLLKESFTWFGYLLICLLLFILPGWALLSAFWNNWRSLNWLEKTGLGAGISLAIYPVFLLWAHLFSLPLGPLFAWLPASLACLVLVWKNRKVPLQILAYARLRRFRKDSLLKLRELPWWEFGLLALMLLIFFARFWAVRAMDVPMWGDSVQHTIIAQLLIDNGGLFSSWEPYAPYQSLTVHYGFPTQVAILSWLTGLPTHTAALQAGQILNGLAIVTLLPFAYRLSPRNNWAAAGTLLIAGLLMPMPAFYTNWGRFAQLTGQAILPVAIWLTCHFLERTPPSDYTYNPQVIADSVRNPSFRGIPLRNLQRDWIPCLIIAIVLAGMVLCYYRMAFYYASFMLAWLVYWGFTQGRNHQRRWIFLFFFILVISTLALLVLSPWFMQVSESALSEKVETSSTNYTAAEVIQTEVKELHNLGNYLPFGIVILSLIGSIWSVLRKRWDVAAIALWVAFLFLFYIGIAILRPGANLFQFFALLIWLYMPAGLICGWLIGETSSWFISHKVNLGLAVFTLTLILLALYGADQTRTITQPQSYGLVTQPDLRAMEWISQNTPIQSRFLVNGFRIYDGASAVGSDAGWWIPLLAGRQNTMPPQYALLAEEPHPADYSQKMVDLVASLELVSPTSPEGARLLCENGITHIYIGQRRGEVGAGARPLLFASDFENNAYELVYHQDLVNIFELKPEMCTIK